MFLTGLTHTVGIHCRSTGQVKFRWQMGTLAQSMTLQQLLSLVVPVFIQIGRRVQAHLSLCVPAALSDDR